MNDQSTEQKLITENLALRVALKEAEKVIDQHCECSSDPEKKHRVWRYKKGSAEDIGEAGYQWVPCKSCAAFREALGKVKPGP
jgi:hypothetical protein